MSDYVQTVTHNDEVTRLRAALEAVLRECERSTLVRSSAIRTIARAALKGSAL